MGLASDYYADDLHVVSLRGELMSLDRMAKLFKPFSTGELKLVVIDALYRTLPAGTDENDNGAMASIYNLIDRFANDLGTGFVLIHHASKGLQSNKSVTDVGAGAGAQSRATDSHIVLRQHETPGAVVLEAASRSFAPLASRCLRWEFPIWKLAPDLDPMKLKPERPRREPKVKAAAEPERKWSVPEFVEAFVTRDAREKDSILARATQEGLSIRKAEMLLGAAVGEQLVHVWNDGRARRYATEPNNLFSGPTTSNSPIDARARTHPSQERAVTRSGGTRGRARAHRSAKGGADER
jgi:hypothetical protein